MARGFGLVSGSSTVVWQVTDDGTFIIGRNMPVTTQISGSLNLRLNGALAASNRWLRLVDAGGQAIWSAMSASVISSVPLGNLSSSTVQDALNELQDSINQLSVGAGSYAFSDGVNNESINSDGSTIIWTGSANQTEVTYNPANNRFTFGLGRNIIHTGTFQVTGFSDHQTMAATTITASANIFVSQQLIVTGNTILGTSGSAVNTIQLNGQFRYPIFTINTVPSAFSSTPQQFPGYSFYLQGAGAPGHFEVGDKWYFNERGVWFPSMFFSGS